MAVGAWSRCRKLNRIKRKDSFIVLVLYPLRGVASGHQSSSALRRGPRCHTVLSKVTLQRRRVNGNIACEVFFLKRFLFFCIP